MTEKLYETDSHLKEFEATVLSCEGQDDVYKTVLSKTAFFPEGGGQAADRGYIAEAFVSNVQIENGIIYHYTDTPLKKGKTVRCSLDWQRRFRNMQNHSGEHIISGLVHKLYGLDNIGFHLGETEMTMDFNGPLTRADLLKIEELANRAIYENARFRAYYPENFREMQYRSKLDLQENVRIVEIEGYDVCACCAPHVNSACEIGVIKILDSFKNKGGVRLFVKCGLDALYDYNQKYDNVLKISNLLCVKQDESAEGAQKLCDQIGGLKFEISGLKKRIIAQKVENFRSDALISAEFEEDLDIKELQLYADALYKKAGGIRAVFGGKDGEYSFAVCGEEKALAEFFAGFKSALNVRGGGRGTMVQGTVLADRQSILKIIL